MHLGLLAIGEALAGERALLSANAIVERGEIGCLLPRGGWGQGGVLCE